MQCPGYLLQIFGMLATLCYSCSLNLYYLAMVKHNKTETYICTKIEPFLHSIPILLALIGSMINLVDKNYNAELGDGDCTGSPTYNPPHCEGYNEGEVREGFEIPCGRGRFGNLYAVSVTLCAAILWVTPITICVSLGTIYRSVTEQERRIARYGVGALNPSAQHTSGDDTNERANEGNVHQSGSFVSSILSSILHRFGMRRGSSNLHTGGGDNSNSRAVVHKAFAFTLAYFLSWTWPLIGGIMMGFGVETPLAFYYMWAIINPLQGVSGKLVFKCIAIPPLSLAHSPRHFPLSFTSYSTFSLIYTQKR